MYSPLSRGWPQYNWQIQAQSNPDRTLSLFTHGQYSLIEKKSQWFVAVTHVTCRCSVSLAM